MENWIEHYIIIIIINGIYNRTLILSYSGQIITWRLRNKRWNEKRIYPEKLLPKTVAACYYYYFFVPVPNNRFETESTLTTYTNGPIRYRFNLVSNRKKGIWILEPRILFIYLLILFFIKQWKWKTKIELEGAKQKSISPFDSIPGNSQCHWWK